MSKYSDYLKERKKKHIEFFFQQQVKWESNKYLRFKECIDDDNIILLLDEYKLHYVKLNPVLLVGKNKAVYLKEWQIEPFHKWFAESKTGIQGYCIKLNRKYFKPYTFTDEFRKWWGGDTETTFDDLLEKAKRHDAENGEWIMPISLGFFKGEFEPIR